MSYIKNKFHDQIYILGSLDNRDFDSLYGIKFTVEGKTVHIDDFIVSESTEDIMVCVDVYEGGIFSRENHTYIIMDECDFRKIAWHAENVQYPEYVYTDEE